MSKDKFSSRYSVNDHGCWIWNGKYTAHRRYGAFFLNGRLEQSHRASWMMFKGEIPKGVCVLHQCDVPSCVNPDHLFLGTSKDNTQDMMKKGRHNGNYKLTPSQAIEIRNSDEDSRVLAQRYGISRLHVYDIKAKRYWKSL